MKKMKSRTSKNLKRNLIILIIVLIIVSVGLYFIISGTKGSSKKSNVVEEIKGYKYTLDDRDTVYMRSVFRELKTVLTASELDYEKYAEDLSKLYVIDLYTINNKTSKYDVGSYEYVHPDGEENFKLQVEDTIYKYMGLFEKKELPEVTNATVSDITEDKYTYNEKEYDAYKLHIEWEYKEDLGYDKSADVVLMKDDKYLYIVEFNPEVE